MEGFIVWMLDVLTVTKPNGKQRQNGHIHLFTPLEHPHLSQTWLHQHTTRTPLRSLFKGGEHQGGHEQQGYEPSHAPVEWIFWVAVWCESIAYQIQNVICYGHVQSSLNKKVQPADELKGCSMLCLLQFIEIMKWARSPLQMLIRTQEGIRMSSSSSSLITPQIYKFGRRHCVLGSSY